MVAFYASLLVTVAMTGIAMLVLMRRPKDKPLTWGEAFIGATYVFALFLLAYAIVPHQFITMCDKDFGWRSDTFGIPTGPLHYLPGPWHGKHLLWADGVTFFGRGRLLVNQQTIRDIIVTNIYVVAVTTQFKLWGIAQKRGEKTAEVVPVSPYGRPLVKKAQ
ncbi:MAG: hypothetical protein Q8K63_10750 [Acidimicrobiales bacterium]|nr:hypothetical protein [Acidimicrobiales bacterium]